jgi:hypothetical protein
MEFLNHFFGTCGEYHPNIYTVLMFGMVIAGLSKLVLKIRKTN